MDHRIHTYLYRLLTACAAIVVFNACMPEQLPAINNYIGTPASTVKRQAPAGSRCPQHYTAAMNAGWTHDQWSKIDFIMWRESRCTSTAYNGRGRDNSYGLMQLNMKAHKSWVGPMVNWDFTQLYNPTVNLTVAKALYTRAQKMFGCGFQPWKTTKQRHWCN